MSMVTRHGLSPLQTRASRFLAALWFIMLNVAARMETPAFPLFRRLSLVFSKVGRLFLSTPIRFPSVIRAFYRTSVVS
jgi:hypothetical protein